MTERFCPYSLSPDEIIAFTPHWDGERSPDGRPHVADSILERMQHVSMTQVWGSLRGAGFNWQFDGNWINTHPGEVLVGRAVTAIFAPRRPDLREAIDERAARAGCEGDHIHWPINALQPGDVYVADVFGKIEQGAVIGDNLASAIFTNSGNGLVHNGAVRDLGGIKAIPGFASLIKGFHPSFAAPTILLLGLNTPVRIGGVTIMPGDVILGGDEGLTVVPPHLAERIVMVAEIVHLRDEFGQQRMREGTYLPGEIDGRWSDTIEEDFAGWVLNRADELPVPVEKMQDLLKSRTW